ncbi:hypothetical protein ACU4GD_26785 [Cupriavidus basilensis]
MAWLLVDRYTRTTRMLADLNRDLDHKVAQKEQELHRALRPLARGRTRAGHAKGTRAHHA